MREWTKSVCYILALAVLLSWAAQTASGLAEEGIGNAPLNEHNYREFKGVMPVINHHSRVYNMWINGNEHFYYSGETKLLNEVLEKFAGVARPVREVILCPGPGETKMFSGEQVTYDWYLHVLGGISRHLVADNNDTTNLFAKYPTLTVLVGGGNVELKKIQIPKGVTVIRLSDLRARYLKGLKSKDKYEVRGYAAYYLGSLDFYNKDSAEAIAALLDDSNDWVRLMAAGAIGMFGKNAESVLPVLKRGLQTGNERQRKSFEETIKKIEAAKDTARAAKKHRLMLHKIDKFYKSLAKERAKSKSAGGNHE